MYDNPSFIRATVAVSQEQALKAGLALSNDSSKSLIDTGRPPGLFFHPGNNDRIRKIAEDKAKWIGEKNEKIPVVIELQITPENFSIFQGRINTARYEGLPGREIIIYTPIARYEDLENNQRAATIRLDELTHEDLAVMGVKVGFPGRDGNFDYKPYLEWSEALGVKAITKEEKEMTKEGHLPQMLK